MDIKYFMDKLPKSFPWVTEEELILLYSDAVDPHLTRDLENCLEWIGKESAAGLKFKRPVATRWRIDNLLAESAVGLSVENALYFWNEAFKFESNPLPLLLIQDLEPASFAGVLVFLIRRGLSAAEILESKLLQNFFKCNALDMEKVTTAWKQLQNFIVPESAESEAIRELIDLASATRGISPAPTQESLEYFLRAYSLTGQIVEKFAEDVAMESDEDIDIADEPSSESNHISFTYSKENFQNLYLYFGDAILIYGLEHFEADDAIKELIIERCKAKDANSLGQLYSQIETEEPEKRIVIINRLSGFLNKQQIIAMLDSETSKIYFFALLMGNNDLLRWYTEEELCVFFEHSLRGEDLYYLNGIGCLAEDGYFYPVAILNNILTLLLEHPETFEGPIDFENIFTALESYPCAHDWRRERDQGLLDELNAQLDECCDDFNVGSFLALSNHKAEQVAFLNKLKKFSSQPLTYPLEPYKFYAYLVVYLYRKSICFDLELILETIASTIYSDYRCLPEEKPSHILVAKQHILAESFVLSGEPDLLDQISQYLVRTEACLTHLDKKIKPSLFDQVVNTQHINLLSHFINSQSPARSIRSISARFNAITNKILFFFLVHHEAIFLSFWSAADTDLRLEILEKTTHESSYRNLLDMLIQKNLDLASHCLQSIINGDKTKSDRLLQLLTPPLLDRETPFSVIAHCFDEATLDKTLSLFDPERLDDLLKQPVRPQFDSAIHILIERAKPSAARNIAFQKLTDLSISFLKKILKTIPENRRLNLLTERSRKDTRTVFACALPYPLKKDSNLALVCAVLSTVPSLDLMYLWITKDATGEMFLTSIEKHKLTEILSDFLPPDLKKTRETLSKFQETVETLKRSGKTKHHSSAKRLGFWGATHKPSDPRPDEKKHLRKSVVAAASIASRTPDRLIPEASSDSAELESRL